MLKFIHFLEFIIIFFFFIKTSKFSKCLDKNNMTNILNLSFCISDLNNNNDSNNLEDKPSDDEILNNSINTIIETEDTTYDSKTNNNPNLMDTGEKEIDCCLLTIRQESEADIKKCIEIKKDEDEIEKRTDAFQIMFKNAEISIDCEHKYIYVKFLPIILFFVINLIF